MNRYLYISIIAGLTLAGCYSGNQMAQSPYNVGQDNYYQQSPSSGDVSYQSFYDALQPYGNWVDYPGYGYVWQPALGADFRPYETNGHWVSTVDGWAWASSYNWGWAPFHYGRWLLDPSLGWVWVPGYDWAPAWVSWGEYNDYYAWAPLAPGINISIGSGWRAPYNYWSFVPRNCIAYGNLNRYIARNNYNPTVVNNITIINNYNSYNNRNYFLRGPQYSQVEQYTHQPIRLVSIAPATRPGGARVTDRQFQIYRPAITPNNANANIAPRRVTRLDDVRNQNSGMTGAPINTNGNIRNNPPNSTINGNGMNSTDGTIRRPQRDNSFPDGQPARTLPSQNNGDGLNNNTVVRPLPQNNASQPLPGTNGDNPANANPNPGTINGRSDDRFNNRPVFRDPTNSQNNGVTRQQQQNIPQVTPSQQPQQDVRQRPVFQRPEYNTPNSGNQDRIRQQPVMRQPNFDMNKQPQRVFNNPAPRSEPQHQPAPVSRPVNRKKD